MVSSLAVLPTAAFVAAVTSHTASLFTGNKAGLMKQHLPFFYRDPPAASRSVSLAAMTASMRPNIDALAS